MVSIIICSRKNDISSKLKENIAQTIGCGFELVTIDNSKNQYNIFQAYNVGVQRSKGDILCFMHDDILFHSKNWGNIVYDYFKDYPNLGCLGVAGGHLMLDTPSSFWHSEAMCLHYCGRNEGGNLFIIDDTKYRKPKGITQVASVDGIWMCIRRSLFNSIQFDEETYHGFHCYDSDICMQILQVGYDIGIAFEVLVEHTKMGVQDSNYFESIRKWHKKWHHCLPMARGAEFTKEDIDLRTTFVESIIYLEKRISETEQSHISKFFLLRRAISREIKKVLNK